MTTRVRKKAPSARQMARVTGELETLRRHLDQVETLLGESEDRRIGLVEDLEVSKGVAIDEHTLVLEMRETIKALRDEVRLTDRNYTHVARQLQVEMENGRNSGDAAAVLAYLLMPSGSLKDIMANFRQTAMKLGVGAEVKKAATEAISSAATAYAAGEWPDDKLAERMMAEGGGSHMSLLDMLASSLGPEGAGPLAAIFSGGPRRTRESSPGDPMAEIFGGGEMDLDDLFAPRRR